MIKMRGDQSTPPSKKKRGGVENPSTDLIKNMMKLSPQDIDIPIPDLPKTTDDVEGFMSAYRVRLELAQAAVGLEQLELEREKVEFERQQMLRQSLREQTEIEILLSQKLNHELDLQRSSLDLEAMNRQSRKALASPDQTLIYQFFSPVTSETVGQAMQTLTHWSAIHPKKPIEFQISSQGGSALDGLALYDFLTTLKQKGHIITTTGLGCVASMASVLLQAGDIRTLGASSFIMVHEVEWTGAGKLSTLVDEHEFNQRLQAKILDILCQKSNIGTEQLEAMFKKKDVWLSAEECLLNGLIDKII